MSDQTVRGSELQGVYADPIPHSANSRMPMPDPPAPSQRPLPRQIQINPLNHGYHVIVGCQAFAVENVDSLLHRLGIYLKNPEQAEKNWLTGEWKM